MKAKYYKFSDKLFYALLKNGCMLSFANELGDDRINISLLPFAFSIDECTEITKAEFQLEFSVVINQLNKIIGL